MTTKTIHKRPPVSINREQGLSLVLTIVVLLAVTSLALAATNSNQSQSLMVRNAQLRLEAFNASYNEIEGQVATINELKLSDGPPDYVLALIDSNVGEIVNATTVVPLPSVTEVSDDQITQSVAQEYVGTCRVPGQQTGAGFEKVQCSQVLIDSKAEIDDTAVGSNQNQVYQYQTLKES